MAKPSPNPDILLHQQLQPHTYPHIEGKLKSLFSIPPNVINQVHLKMNELYTKSNIRNPVLSSQIHKIILDIFTTDYYPLVSRNLKSDNHTIAVIMGGCAYNMNIPIKMNNILYIPTDDIDMKIYTTDINTLSKPPVKVAQVLSIFKYLVVIICLYMKQIVTEIIEYSRNAFEPTEPYKKHTMKNIDLKSMKHNYSKSHTKKSYTKNQLGGNYNKKQNLIKLKQRRFGVLKSYKIKIQIKNKNKNKNNNNNNNNNKINLVNEKEIIDITDLSYEETYKLIMSKIDDPDIMITTKISYSFKYINLIVPYNNNSRPTITFSDTKIIYPNIHNPSFFTYYFMKNIQTPNITLEELLIQTHKKHNLNISDIIDTKACKNNCRYISVKCLQIDLIYMLRFAELLVDEDISNNIILVPVDSLFKYYKYMIKFIRLHIIKKFFNGTLSNNKLFIDNARKLMRFVENNLKKETSQFGESLPINILYKNIISDFHQAFFIKKTMFPEYNALIDIVDDYNNTVKYINRSCALFKTLDDKQEDSRETSDSISIQYADKKMSSDISNEKMDNMDNMDGGKYLQKKIKDESNSKSNSKSKIFLHNDYSFEDVDLDNNKNIKHSETHKYTKTENIIIIDKLHKIIKNEIKFLGQLSQSIKK